MGQSTSNPSTDGVKHVFSSDAPVRLAPDVSGSLQDSPEVFCSATRPISESAQNTDDFVRALQSDTTRAKDLELLIQRRVREELTRLEAEQSRTIKAIEEQISASPDTAKPNDKTQDLGRENVMREIDSLRKKLGQRKLREDVVQDTAVKKAKEDVVHCLRINDRRPLDCWQEVETFKREVGRLERAFLGRVLE